MNPSAHHKKMNGDSPCSGCQNAPQCKREQLACFDFLYFVEVGKVVCSDRKPSNMMYRQMFKCDDEEQELVLKSTD